MKHKSIENVNNNVTRKVCVLFFLLNFAFSQEKLELKQADSLSSKEQNSETITILKGNIIFQKGDTFLSGDKAIQSNKNSQLKLYDNVKVDDKNNTIFCDSLFYDTEQEQIELLGSVTIKNENQLITADKGLINNIDGKIKLLKNGKILSQNQIVRGDLIEIFSKENQIESLKVYENGIIISENTGYEKDKNNQNQLIINQDILKAEVIELKINENEMSEIELIGMASSFIHLYEDSLYQGTNEI